MRKHYGLMVTHSLPQIRLFFFAGHADTKDGMHLLSVSIANSKQNKIGGKLQLEPFQ